MTAMFGFGSSIIRRQLASLNPESTLTIAPLRGAMPMVWSAEGRSEYEGHLDNLFLEIPTGEFVYSAPNGELKNSGPSNGQRQIILRHYFDRWFDERGQDPTKTELILLDEVQKGGSLSTLNDIVRVEIRRRSMPSYIRVIAAQDNRRRIVAQPKTAGYGKLSSNSVPRTNVSVVPMPLIATDKSEMLDSVILEGAPRDLDAHPDRLTVCRNVLSEKLFRSIGTMARCRGVRHDSTFTWNFLNDQGPMSERGSVLAEGWLKKVVTHFDNLNLESR